MSTSWCIMFVHHKINDMHCHRIALLWWPVSRWFIFLGNSVTVEYRYCMYRSVRGTIDKFTGIIQAVIYKESPWIKDENETKTKNVFKFSLSFLRFSESETQSRKTVFHFGRKLKPDKGNRNCFLFTFIVFAKNEKCKTENIRLVPLSAFRVIVPFASFFSRKTEKEEKTTIGRQG